MVGLSYFKVIGIIVYRLGSGGWCYCFDYNIKVDVGYYKIIVWIVEC